ncbi:MAG: hypothetical protein JWQ95_5660 [Sphaerisporangium sp.]|nr:hypothetical protein [Sphaerisporangium sp.]
MALHQLVPKLANMCLGEMRVAPELRNIWCRELTNLSGAEAILKLRALISFGDFAAYWRYHLDREHHRITKPVTRTDTPSPPDRPTHCGRAAPNPR